MNNRFKKSPGLAKYHTIEHDLRRKIRAGHWAVGAMLPSRRDFAQEYSVAPLTIGRALGPLLADGTLRSDSRRGTFVANVVLPSDNSDMSRNPASGDNRYLVSDGIQGRADNSINHSTRTGVIGISASVYDYGSQDYLVLHSLEQVLSDAGNSTVVVNRGLGKPRVPVLLEDSIEQLIQENVDAIVVICLDMDRLRVEAALSAFDALKIPIVCVLAGELRRPIPHVFYDNYMGGYQTAQYFIRKGIKEISVIAPFTASWVTERITGVRTAMEHMHLSPDELQLVSGKAEPWAFEESPYPIAYEATKAALEAGWRPRNGIVAVNDQVAFGFLDAALEFDFKVGRDFVVIGFDDTPQSRTIGLSTMRAPLEAMGREAARLLLDDLKGTRISLQVRLRGHLIPRASTNMHELSS